MNGFVACFGDPNACSKVSTMLGSIEHRAIEGFGTIVGDHHEEGRSPPKFTESRENCAIGYACASVKDKQFNEGAFHGEVYGPDSEERHLDEISQEGNDFQRIGSKLRCIDGAYAFILRVSNGAVIARDPLGIRPLYISRNGKALYLATEVKAFGAIGITNWNSFPPGNVLWYDQLVSKNHIFDSIDFSGAKSDQTSQDLLSLIEASLRTRASYIGRHVAVAFSGGIDSVLLSSLLSRFCKVHPICVSVANSPDEINAKRAAVMLGLDLDVVRLDKTIISQISQEVSRLIEVEGVMNLSIAIVLREAAKRAQENGFNYIILGQLADELFGGYARYLALRGNSELLRRTLYKDVVSAHLGNFERDDKATAPFVRTILPYSYIPLVKFSLGIPLANKIDPETGQRKKCLREVALLADVPQQLALQDKKAMQYGSGVQKLVTRLENFRANVNI